MDVSESGTGTGNFYMTLKRQRLDPNLFDDLEDFEYCDSSSNYIFAFIKATLFTNFNEHRSMLSCHCQILHFCSLECFMAPNFL